jgi:phthiocerol/phenolphthiocerol synthesis type-I polyketide synthase E
MSGRFPGARTIDEFWQNLRDGVESIAFFTDEDVLASGTDPAFLSYPNFVKAYGVLDNIEMFDAPFFGISPREATLLDPQHRLFLECAWEALENAGYDSEVYDGRIGVYAGANISTYLLRNLLPNDVFVFVTADRFEMALTNNKDVMPMRVSYQMNLTGPSLNISTTCSTSLVTAHMACQSLLTYQCDMVLAGGSHVRVPQKEGYLFQEGMIWSPDGHVRTFDAQSRGVVTGNGVGIIVLKRLEDALADGDYIYAIIRGSASNNDGSTKIGYTAPSIDGQAEATTEAISLAGVNSDTITYVEAHGTGTELGDPIEVASLTKAFRATAADPDNLNQQFCALGSVKTNIGHLNHAAGVGGLIKTILALHHKQLPPSLNFQSPNPSIDFANSPFYVNTTLREWHTDGTPRRAGVNSFGVGGTNAHAVLEEAPDRQPSGSSRPWQLLLLSAKTDSALETATANLAWHCKQHPELNLADTAYTLQLGRKAFDYRRVVTCQHPDEAARALETLDPKRVLTAFQQAKDRPVVFLFSGQGAQYVNMARDLYEVEPTFREQVDRCADLLTPHLGLDLRHRLYPSAGKAAAAAQQLQQTAMTQAALFVIEYALAQLWMEWGIRPRAMLGHSVGEYVAACLAGVFSLEEALSLVAARGHMMQQLPPGDMLVVPLPPDALQPLLGEELSLAVINGPAMCVAAGPAGAVEALQQQLAAKGVTCRLLHTSHAFHSAMMAPIIEPFTARVKQVHLEPPHIPYLSNVTGTWITAADATDPSYWARHLRHTVRFAEGLQELLQDPAHILLEVGPGRTLSTLANQHPAKAREQVVLTSLRHPQEQQADVAFLLTTLGKLWLAGAKVNWAGFYTHERRHRLPLPTYPFERQRYWIDTPRHQAAAGGARSRPIVSELAQEAKREEQALPSSRPSVSSAPRNETEQKIAAVWQQFLSLEQIGIHDDFFDLGGSSFTAGQLLIQLRNILQADVSLQSFLNARTIAELAGLIDTCPATPKTVDAQDRPEPPSALVKIKDGHNQAQPIFLVHPIDGQVLIYRDLAHGLDGKRPVYAFQAPGLAGEAEPLAQIEAMATHCINAMRTLQPDGPYLLGGASFGGIVAFEMAQQLRARSQGVDLLFLIDAPTSGQPLLALEDDPAILGFIAENLLKLDRGHVSVNDLRERTLEDQIAYLLERTKNGQEQPARFEAAQLWQWVHVIKAHQEAVKTYTPHLYPGRLIFFRAQEPWEKEMTCHPEHFWVDLAGGGIEINPVPGNHVTMNYQPHVQVIANRLNLSLWQVERGAKGD